MFFRSPLVWTSTSRRSTCHQHNQIKTSSVAKNSHHRNVTQVRNSQFLSSPGNLDHGSRTWWERVRLLNALDISKRSQNGMRWSLLHGSPGWWGRWNHENQISNKTETGEGEETEEEEEEMFLQTETDGTNGRTWKCRDTQPKWMLES